MKHFATYVCFNGKPKKVEFTQHKSRQMYISNVVDYKGHEINLVKSYDLFMYRVKKFSHDDLEMLTTYLKEVA